MDIQPQARPELTFRPVTTDIWPDMQTLFSERGVQHGCWCMFWRLTRTEFSRGYGEPHRRAMEAIIASGRVPGILAYLAGQPAAWCSVAPREEFPSLDRSRTLGRVDDQPVWSITCFFVARAHRRQRLTRALVGAALDYAQSQGGRIVEAYPLIPTPTGYALPELYMGTLPLFEELGFRAIARRSARRAIVRWEAPALPSASDAHL